MHEYLPRSFFRIVVEAIRLSIRSFFKFWFISVPLFLLLFTLSVVTLQPSKSEIGWIALINLALSSLPPVIALYRREMLSHVSPVGVTIGLTECIRIKNKEYLDVDYDTDKIYLQQESEVNEIISDFHPFRSMQVNVRIIRRPKLFYLLNDLLSLKTHLKLHLGPDDFSCILLIIKDVDSQKMHFDAITPEGAFNSISTLKEFKELFDFPIKNDALYDDYVIAVCNVFTSIMGQSVLDYNISEGNFGIAHRIIDDCKQLFTSALDKIDKLLKEDRLIERNQFKQKMLCNFERYTAIIYLNQKEYLPAISHLFSAIKLSPYFPYNDPEDHRNSFNRQYTSTIANRVAFFHDPMLEGKPNENFIKETAKSEELAKSVNQNGIPSFEELLKEIILSANSNEVNKKIEGILKENFIEEPIQHLIRGEVLKYLPLGSEKCNQLYIKRLPEVIKEFELLMEKDPFFIITYTRLGTLKIIAASYEGGKKKRDILIKEGFDTLKLGKEVLVKMGFHVGTN